ncbi:MAG: carboxypeptidase-like regulatory domain-containing protein [Nannocystaceae bacterium]
MALALACNGGDATSATDGGTAPTTATSSSTDTDSDASGSASDTAQTTAGPTATDASSSGSSDTDVIYDVAVDSDTAGETDACNPMGDALLSGVVHAPNGALPISGALVYVTDDAPTIPQTVFCSECVDLPCGTPHTFTGPDGSFTLGVAPGAHTLVVRKGQFMRVTPVQVAEGDVPLGPELTDLPGHNSPPTGEYIPRIALALGDHDRLENGLAKLGLGDTMIDDYKEEVTPGSEQFDVWDNAPDRDFPGSKGQFGMLLASYELMEQYHIIFVPCTMQAGEYPSFLDDPLVVDNLRKWVAKGGKLYVADWSNEVLSTGFPQYQTFWQRKDSDKIDPWQGDPTADLGHYDPLGTVLDAELEAWLAALPPELKDINPKNDPQSEPFPVIDSLPELQTVYAYSGLRETPPVLVDDGMGGQVDVGHKTWIEGWGSETWGVPPPDGKYPLTVTGEYGCGRILFTAYHTVEGSSYTGLTPQELVLMYLILEIGVCQVPFDPPV